MNGPSPSKLWSPPAVLGPAAEPSFPFSKAALLFPQATDPGLPTLCPSFGSPCALAWNSSSSCHKIAQ